jgi:hypothetical protein
MYRILGSGAIAHERHRQPEKRRPVAFEQNAQAGGVACLGRANELGIL